MAARSLVACVLVTAFALAACASSPPAAPASPGRAGAGDEQPAGSDVCPLPDADGSAEELLSGGVTELSAEAIELMTAYDYPAGGPMVSAEDPGWSWEERVTTITEQLEARLSCRPEDVQAKALDNHRRLMDKGNDPQIAAAIAIWTGIVDSTVDAYLSPAMDVAVHRQPSNPDFNAEMTSLPNGIRKVIVNETDRFEDFVWLAPSMLHEPLHDSDRNGRPEEAFAHLMENYYLAALLVEQGLRDPRALDELLEQRTLLSRVQLQDVVGVVFNSATMLQGRGPLFPGSALPDTVDSYYEDAPALLAVPDVPTAADPAGRENYATALLASAGVEVEDPELFDRAFLESIDIAQLIDAPGGLEPAGLQLLADAMGLRMPGSS